ncbi:cation diffusion zinc membrane transporter Zrg17 [Podospora pseudoanserina]|uniref:Zinc transporter n=1 Tax=Podospora pseudoanserina TaxID=2609844 RepID=A0ABR0IG17_9PEZI|nr:cation diffusion zinc membrane transporter Zrg17 [Podospora pseudoanserina]
MAPGPKPSLQPPGTPPTPVFAITGQHGEPSFHFVCDDFDLDQQQQQPGRSHPNNEPEATVRSEPEAAPFSSPVQHYLAPSPRSSPAAFLDPYSHHPSLRPPTPDHLFNSMSSDGGLAANGGDAPAMKNPFNFQTQIISSGPVKSNIGQRRGHRYKHSSISATHQIFQEPPPRPPPVLPASLPIPTLREAWSSMQRDQKARLWWCSLHAFIALYVFLSAEGSLAMTALSHLVFFDVGSAAVCVAVDVLGNFEVWRRSSIRHPFGLQRAEVLAGFAMSVFLVFGGFDLISHSMKDVLESVGHHAPHHPVSTTDDSSQPAGGGHGGGGHSHGARYITPGTLDLASFAAFVSTLISAYGLRNHGRIRRVMRVPLPYLSSLLPESTILSNPFHFLTLFFSGIMLVLPLVYIPHIIWLDRLICATISLSMFFLGARLAVGQGFMLLMSYNHVDSKKQKGDSSEVASVIKEIESEPQVQRVEEAQFWQVHYGLAMANLKVKVKGGEMMGGGQGLDGAVSQLRQRLGRVVQNRLGEGYGRGGSLRWEVTVQMSSD